MIIESSFEKPLLLNICHEDSSGCNMHEENVNSDFSFACHSKNVVDMIVVENQLKNLDNEII